MLEPKKMPTLKGTMASDAFTIRAEPPLTTNKIKTVAITAVTI
jgi:hypothetical protein